VCYILTNSLAFAQVSASRDEAERHRLAANDAESRFALLVAECDALKTQLAAAEAGAATAARVRLQPRHRRRWHAIAHNLHGVFPNCAGGWFSGFFFEKNTGEAGFGAEVGAGPRPPPPRPCHSNSRR
jgi:hypothetical protein